MLEIICIPCFQILNVLLQIKTRQPFWELTHGHCVCKFEYNTQSNPLSLPQLVGCQTRKDAHLIARINTKSQCKQNKTAKQKQQNKNASERTVSTRGFKVFYWPNLYVMREMIVKSVSKNKTKQTNKKQSAQRSHVRDLVDTLT